MSEEIEETRLVPVRKGKLAPFSEGILISRTVRVIPDDWACPVCGATNDNTLGACWECGWEKEDDGKA